MATKPPKAAPKPAPDAAAAAPAATHPKKGGILKIAILLIVMLGCGAGGAWYFLKANHAEEGGKSAAKGAVKGEGTKVVSTKPPLFVPLEQFTVNLQQEDSNPQFLQVTLVVKVTESMVADAIKLRMPELRNRVLLLLSGKKPRELSTVEGKNTLSTELVSEITQALGGNIPPETIDSVLFTSFVIQ